MQLSVVILSNITDSASAELLVDAVSSLSSSISHNDYEVIVVESGDLFQSENIIGKRGIVIAYDFKDFNFHKALNQGFIKARGEYVCFSNNDVIFHENWFENIKNVLEKNGLNAGSPVDPKDDKLWMFDKSNLSFIEGYEIQKFFKGWCFVIENQSMKRLKKFDERFQFYFADNDFVLELLKFNIRHAVVLNSFVEHREKHQVKMIENLEELKEINGRLFDTIPPEIIENKHFWKIQNTKMTAGLIEFHKKWGTMSMLHRKFKIALLLTKYRLGFLNRLVLFSSHQS
ncbi:glycosyltransferase family 2 protein [Nonlabens ulvanivorans]|uniref:glycosyltransferase family 2 protein n=1 Tax=Nonlabens ulvanivorans TaxID=906888 RepID=UPI002942110A|nr:glycosyltransferase [Nonlabens ulvanivorans]WOI23096.1 glycosyltransferase [Nonlabens ulvanivorans]